MNDSPSNPSSIEAVKRILPIKGTSNFRDIGGYATRDGRRVRHGLFFRSDALHNLKGDGLEKLAALNLKTVIDLRSCEEAESEPDRLPPECRARLIHLPIDLKGLPPSEVRKKLINGRVGENEFMTKLTGAYHEMVTGQAGLLATLFETITDPSSYPLLVHCVGGKDRTGMASALTLLILGVDLETIFQDYLFITKSRRRNAEYSFKLLWIISLFRTPPHKVRPLWEARSEYLQAAVDAILQTAGTVESYFEQVLGITPEKRSALQELLLTNE